MSVHSYKVSQIIIAIGTHARMLGAVQCSLANSKIWKKDGRGIHNMTGLMGWLIIYSKYSHPKLAHNE
jgi:hypothetical protein